MPRKLQVVLLVLLSLAASLPAGSALAHVARHGRHHAIKRAHRRSRHHRPRQVGMVGLAVSRSVGHRPPSGKQGPTPPTGSGAPAGSTPSPPAAPSPSIGPLSIVTPFPTGMRLFSSTSVWNAPLATNAPLDPRSSQLSAVLAAEVDQEIPARTGPWINTNAWSVPVYTVGTGVPTVRVTLDAAAPALQQKLNAVPIPADAHPAADGDQDMVIYQPGTNTEWDLWQAGNGANGWHAGWGGVMNTVSTNPGYFPAPYGGSGTGLPFLGGLMTIHELLTGQINHALSIAIPNTAAGTFTWPAQRGDGRTTGPSAIPEGTHFRIDPSLNLSTLGLSRVGLAMARAVQRYGMIVRDTGGNVAFYAEDPTTTVGNPYAQIFGNQYPNAVLQGFPWNHLQVVAPSAG